jgi:hypothetical protein
VLCIAPSTSPPSHNTRGELFGRGFHVNRPAVRCLHCAMRDERRGPAAHYYYSQWMPRACMRYLGHERGPNASISGRKPFWGGIECVPHSFKVLVRWVELTGLKWICATLKWKRGIRDALSTTCKLGRPNANMRTGVAVFELCRFEFKALIWVVRSPARILGRVDRFEVDLRYLEMETWN